jgi:hypothetical protein
MKKSNSKAHEDNSEVPPMASRPAYASQNRPAYASQKEKLRVPPVLNKKALYGIAGSIARKMARSSEADAAAVLIQFLAVFGNMVGRQPCFRVSGSYHHCNLNVALVGRSAKSRKGLALDVVLSSFSWLDEEYCNHNVKQGLSTGEGLIAHVQDPVIKFRQPNAHEKKEGISGLVEYVAEPGVADKRLLATETEFGGLIVAMGREGNNLSAIIRQFWDGRDKVSTLTRNSPLCATRAHVSICGHITQPELFTRLPEVENFNGFANRFLWTHLSREQYLSSPPDLSPGMFTEELDYFRLPNAREGKPFFERLRSIHQMTREAEAKAYWDEIYQKVEREEEANPQLDGVLSRVSAQMLRLSMIYALLDGSAMVKREHIEAAYALWRYCRDTAKYLFAEKLSSAHAERIYAALKVCAPKEMNKTQIGDIFGKNLAANVQNAALDELEKAELVKKRVTRGKGPPETFYSIR